MHTLQKNDKRGNFWDVKTLNSPLTDEVFETLWSGPYTKIERIISSGQVSPPGFWYDQDECEWVLLLQGSATLEYENEPRIEMTAGDWLVIPPHCRHRVAYTSSNPICIWLTVYNKSN